MDIYAWDINKEENALPSIGCAGHFYLHGMLNFENGYDICGMKRDEYPVNDGIYQVTVHFENGMPDKSAIFYYWRSDGYPRGLVCNVNDIDANKSAKEQYEKKERWL